MAIYNTKYRMQFDSDKKTISIDFMFKSYVGAVTDLICPVVPVIHKWNTNDPFEPVRGSSLDIKIISTPTVSIFSFFSSEDDGVKVVMYHSLGTLFEGFLVQDDFSESVVEYSHEINLSATDNLGLLKDINLSDANRLFGDNRSKTVNINIIDPSGLFGFPNIISISADTTFVPIAVGDILIISGTGQIFDGVEFKILSFGPYNGDMLLTVDKYAYAYGNFTGATLTFFHAASLDLSIKQSLASMFAVCLNATNLQLKSNVFIKLLHESAFTQILTQTYIRPTDFRNGEIYLSCYDFINAILNSFNACIMQKDGAWHIIRFIELVYNTSSYEQYDRNFVLNGVTGDYNGNKYYDGNSILAAPLQQLERPYKYVKETFLYKGLDNVLSNGNFAELGILLRTIITGTGVNLVTNREYAAPKWTSGFWWNSAGTILGNNKTNFFIRVVTNYRNEETERYGVVAGRVGFDDSAAVVSKYIETTAGDRIEFSITMRTSNSIAGPGNAPIRLNNVSHLPLVPRKPYYQLRSDLQWGAPSSIVASWASSENRNQWKTFDFASFEFPTDGRLYIYLPQVSLNRGNYYETHIKGLSLKYVPQVQGHKSVKGHTHTDTQFQNIKNNKEIALVVDDTKTNLLIGTLFKPPNNLLVDDRTRNWRRSPVAEQRKLGEIVTIEREFQRNIPRVLVDVSLLDIYKAGFLSPFNRIVWDRFTNYYFLFGNLEIDYANNKAKGSLHELAKVGENLTNLHTYTFNYLYE